MTLMPVDLGTPQVASVTGHRLTAAMDCVGVLRMCECGTGIAVDLGDDLEVRRRHRRHLAAATAAAAIAEEARP